MIANNTQYSCEIPHIHDRTLPEPGSLVGYTAIINALELEVPIPDIVSIISKKNKRYEEDGWKVFTPKHQPEDSLYHHLVFALKYEGINLLLFKKLFQSLSESEIIEILQIAPTGQYSRKIWFLYEWLMDNKLDIPDLRIKNAVPLLDDKLQYTGKGVSSPRHRILNNLPGTSTFCPLIRKTEKLQAFIHSNLADRKNDYLQSVHKDVLQRASGFLLLKDSKASFTIEGETPGNKRAQRWGEAIGQAGSQPLTKDELLRLQKLVIENSRFTAMGYREAGGFVGSHDRLTGEPIPDHISARWQDVSSLLDGLIEMDHLLEESDYDSVLAAAIIAFSFVFIHPFVDGNGRLHRYLIHHILAKMNFTQQGIVFPVSASMLDHIGDYQKVLESYSRPLLEFIEWKATSKGNVEVLNETSDYYRYFDATKQAEFLYASVQDTVETIIPYEVDYLNHYFEMKRYLDNNYEMPDGTVALLVRFLEQNGGKLSIRARSKEFRALSNDEVTDIENVYQEIFEIIK
ncbi:MAG: Fic family protein [Candidatus Marinimicrobia bacterium]|nr:Fic family protein [Candidatus Neomarinimicrobiota bacterium]